MGRHKGCIPWNKGLTKASGDPRMQNVGGFHSLEVNSKISDSLMGHSVSTKTRQKIRESCLGRPCSEETKQKIGFILRGRTHPSYIKGMIFGPCPQERRDRISATLTGRPQSEEHRRKNSESLTRLWENPEYAQMMFDIWNKRPTNPEKIIDEVLRTEFLGEMKYVGNGKVWIGRRNPDFISINERKKIIEVFGIYWHLDRKNIPYELTEQGRKEHFAKFGYQTLVIWDDELDDLDAVVKKIRVFLGI